MYIQYNGGCKIETSRRLPSIHVMHLESRLISKIGLLSKEVGENYIFL